jgi:hypothetical protein
VLFRSLSESDLPQQIADEILSRLKPDDKLVAQFGIGKHIDHVTVRLASELLNKPLLHVADIPYLFKTPEHLNEHTVGMKEKVEMVSDAGVRSWIEAVLAYESQISMLFKNPNVAKNQIEEYCQANHGIKFWFR